MASLCCAKGAIDRLIRLIETQPVRPQNGTPIRYTTEAGDISALDFFACAADTTRFYFCGRDGRFEAAGAGAAQLLSAESHASAASAVETIDETLQSRGDDLRYYGAMAFDAADDQIEADDLGAFRFILPRFELRRDNDNTTFSFNTIGTAGDTPDSIKSRLLDSLESIGAARQPSARNRTGALTVLSRDDVPDEETWRQTVADELGVMQSYGIGKIVLARESRLTMAEPVDASLLLRRIIRDSIRTYNICFQFGATAFVASTPECLYKRTGKTIYTEAMAGTRPLGESEEQTRVLKDELINSAKEADEHRYVYENIKAELQRICTDVRVLAERDVLELSHVQHFCSRFEGELKADLSTAHILAALHPTAAVNGFPKDRALERIRKLEPFGRQWYAGPAGWISRDSSDFAVAIRSCLARENHLTLFAGAGIVGESDPAAEWAETEQKMRQFLEVLD